VLEKVPYRIRLDVMMNREAMIEPGEAILVLPIRNWYEWDSVFTTTSTDRTIRAFRGTLAGQNALLPESWQALKRIARHVIGDDLRGFAYSETDEIRRAMEQSIRVYRGIASLSEPHRQMQWGGAYMFADRFGSMPDGRAVFSVLTPQVREVPDGWFMLSTRRGFGQWNSQHRPSVRTDSFTGATTRRAVLMHPDNAARLHLSKGDEVRLATENGRQTTGVCQPDDGVRTGHVQVFWPLANDLIARGVYDPPSCEPDYNVAVQIAAVRAHP
jgi:predicted molibdopterin-dependent oxidoreductase YjgC